jgi:branched-chain amino acid transport system ATP-binding protein
MSSSNLSAGRLTVTDLRAAYGRTEVLHGVSIHADPGECVAVIGRNGAGKSTLLNAIAGSVKVTGGSIVLDDQELGKLKTYERVKLGLSSTMEGHRVFLRQSVRDNLEIAGYLNRHSREVVQDQIQQVCGLFPILAERWNQQAGALSGGQQQMLAIAQSLMTRPSLLLLDEPSAGLAPLLAAELFESLLRLVAEGTLTVVIDEQAESEVLRVATRGYVLNLGQVVTEASASTLMNDPDVADAYIGRMVQGIRKGITNMGTENHG